MAENEYIFKVKEEGLVSKILRTILRPVRYLVSGVFSETPRETHAWNVQVLEKDDSARLWEVLMCVSKGNQNQMSDTDLLRFMPIFGGWKYFNVFAPSQKFGNIKWYIGWKHGGESKVVNIPLSGEVRMLVGPGNTYFFGINAHTGKQIKLFRTKSGTIGSGMHGKIPLL